MVNGFINFLTNKYKGFNFKLLTQTLLSALIISPSYNNGARPTKTTPKI